MLCRLCSLQASNRQLLRTPPLILSHFPCTGSDKENRLKSTRHNFRARVKVPLIRNKWNVLCAKSKQTAAGRLRAKVSPGLLV